MNSHQICPKGKLVKVGEYKMHLYIEGNNMHIPTLVFMAGSATVAPVYDFKSLYSLLSNKFRIVVVEKFGYGYSDICDISRNVDTIISQIREALNSVRVSGPFILIPHSMSGLEAIRWKQKFPNEIRAILGLDMATPLSYKNFNYKNIKKTVPILKIIRKLKIHKIPKLYPLSTLSLNNQEKHQQVLLMHRNAFNINYIREAECFHQNVKTVENNGSVQSPFLLFCSNGKQIDKYWVSNQERFAELVHANLVKYDCGHYLHYFKSEEIAKTVTEFINSLN